LRFGTLRSAPGRSRAISERLARHGKLLEEVGVAERSDGEVPTRVERLLIVDKSVFGPVQRLQNISKLGIVWDRVGLPLRIGWIIRMMRSS
jgi:hypothetical protein